ncbi:hypothetical protein M9458_019083, partial [Cirrhinus mrigala]
MCRCGRQKRGMSAGCQKDDKDGGLSDLSGGREASESESGRGRWEMASAGDGAPLIDGHRGPLQSPKRLTTACNG